jgi:GntR family transcriptional regulator
MADMSAPAIFSARQLEPSGDTPLYLRVKRLVEQAIEAGALKVGDALPSERSIADTLNISRVTVRAAFGELVHEGVLVQRRGSGTYINGAARIEQPLSRLTSFTQDMALRGAKTDADWLERSLGLPTPEEAIKLAISPAQKVSRLHRLRRADGVPLAIERAIVPSTFLPVPDQVRSSLYAFLEAKGFKPVRALQHLRAVAVGERDAGLLNVPSGSPVLFVERVSYLGDGRVVELVKSLYRGDLYDFVAELTLADGERA